jgi:DNA excision repair protein ERCC-5
MLLGGDYTEGVKGVGIVNGMEILKAFPVSSSIETGLKKFREWLDGFDLNDSIDDENPNITEFKRKHKSARSRWVCPKDFPSPTVLHAYSNPVVDSSKDSFTWTEIPDIVALRLFCLQKMGWEKSETDRAIVPVIDEMKKGVRQTRLDGFFMRSEDNIKFADIKSKRLRQVWNLKKNKDDPEES